MRRFAHLPFLAALLLMGLQSGLLAQIAPADALGPEVSNAAEGFAIQPPAGWQAAATVTGEMKLLFLGPRKGRVPPMLAVWVDIGPGNVSDFVNQLRLYYARTRQDNEIIRAHILFTNNQPERVFAEWAYTTQNVRVRVLELILADGERKFTAECSAAADEFSNYQAVFERCLSTFRLLPATGERAIPAFRILPGGRYLNPRHRFSLMPPSGWKADHSGRRGIVVFFGPAGPGGTAPIISVTCPFSTLPLSQYVETVKSVASATVPGFRLIKETPKKVSGGDAYELSFAFNQVSGNNVNVWRNTQLFIGAGDKKYVIMCGALEALYPDFEKTFEDTLESFRIESESQPTAE